MMRTCHTRLDLNEAAQASFSEYAKRYSGAERVLFRLFAEGKRKPGEVKSWFMEKFSFTARQFNSMARAVKGKIDSVIASRDRQIEEFEERIPKLEATVEKLKPGTAKCHNKKRKLGNLRHRLDALKKDKEAGRVKMCFGSRRLFRAQFNLKANGFKDHAAWKRAWEEARSREFFVLGSKDETAGNQGCQLTPLGKGPDPLGKVHYTVKLRLPETPGILRRRNSTENYVVFHASFKRGADQIDAALASGQALSFRFQRDKKGWRMFVTTDVQGKPGIELRKGIVGVDINADHLAVTETDGSGNPFKSRDPDNPGPITHRIPLVTYGCTAEQAADRIGVAVKEVIGIAQQAGKPLAIESLDFSEKKQLLKESGARYARMLSSFSYSMIISTLEARAFDAGIPEIKVNPAYTSVIGKKKFAKRYGLSSHGAAALVIGRRALELSERLSPHSGQGTSDKPELKRHEPVWSFWSKASRRERRLHRLPGRRKTAIPAACRTAAAGTTPGSPGGIPGREPGSGV